VVACLSAVLQLSPAYRSTKPGLFNLLFGAFGMPMGLALCLINGASLFTSNVAYMAAATLERKASCLGAALLLLLSFFTNIAGDLSAPAANCKHLT
jgi:formate/nitrite transporter FocA (FNT family)